MPVVKKRTCKTCNIKKPVSDFYEKNKHDCKKCANKKANAATKYRRQNEEGYAEAQSYRKQHPNKWGTYFYNYIDKYRNEGTNRAKIYLIQRLYNYRKKGQIIKPSKCELCGSDKNIRAVISNEFIFRYINEIPFTPKELILSTKWICHKCVCAERDLNKTKK